jgi:hypothetical protein
MACEIAYSSGKNGLKISELLVKRLEGSLQYLDGLFAAIFKHVSPAAFSRHLSAQLPDHISIAEIKYQLATDGSLQDDLMQTLLSTPNIVSIIVILSTFAFVPP